MSQKAGFSLENLWVDAHSYPAPDGTKGGSGVYNGGIMVGNTDQFAISNRYDFFSKKGLSLPPHYVYHKETETPHRYTPRERSTSAVRIHFDSKNHRYYVK